MTYKTLMVSLNLGESNERVLDVAGSLAQRFDAHVIGIAGGHPMQIEYAEGYATADAYESQGKQMRQQMADVQAEFRNALQARVDKLEWRETQKLESLGDYAASQARRVRCRKAVVAAGQLSGQLAKQLHGLVFKRQQFLAGDARHQPLRASLRRSQSNFLDGHFALAPFF